MKVETKYNLGECLWTINDMKLISFTVGKINVYYDKDGTRINYYPEGSVCDCYKEGVCFPTKKALIEHLGL